MNAFAPMISAHLERHMFLRGGFVNVPRAKRTWTRNMARTTDADYVTIKDVLGDLDDHFFSLRRLHLAPEDRALFRSFGCFMATGHDDVDWGVNVSCANIASHGLPSQLALCLPISGPRQSRKYIGEAEAEDRSLQFVYLKKSKNLLSKVEWAPTGQMYEIGVYYGSAKDDKIGAVMHKYGLTANFFVEIRQDGTIRQLRHVERRSVSFGHGGRKDRGRGPAYATYPVWDYQPVWSGGKYHKDVSVAAQTAAAMFNLAMNRELNINIIARDPDTGFKLVFCVPMHRWKYFFRERLSVLLPSGRRSPIFHFVTAHERLRRNGRSFVRNHVRGERFFQWSGYDISIVLPAKHGVSVADFGAPLVFVDEEPNPSELLTMEESLAMIEPLLGHKLAQKQQTRRSGSVADGAV